MKFSVAILIPIVATPTASSASLNSQQPTISPQSQAVLCCEQKGGVHTTVDVHSIFGQDTQICEYNGQQYQASFFLDSFCGGSAEPIVVAYPQCSHRADGDPTSTPRCLECCLGPYKDYRDNQCGNSDACQQTNSNLYLSCENDCVQTCQDVCKENDETCVAGCSNSNLRGGTSTAECTTTCNNEYFACNNQCNEDRRKSRENA